MALQIILLLVSPFILLFVTIPLAIFATVTTVAAFSALCIRVLLVYLELASALLQRSVKLAHGDEIIPETRLQRRFGEFSKGYRYREVDHPPMVSSTSGDILQQDPERVSEAYSGGEVSRDFEGLGGWRLPGPDKEDTLWINLNSRFELPGLALDGRQRHHHRASTSGDKSTMTMLHSSRARTQNQARADRPPSPEPSFGSRPTSKSTTSLDTANVNRGSRSRRPSASLTWSQGFLTSPLQGSIFPNLAKPGK